MRHPPPDVSVVVPCYRDPESLTDALQSLETQESRASFEIIVVDSGPDDRVVSVAGRHGVRCIRGPGRLLSGDARNLGSNHARGAILAFIDSDCVAEPGWIDAVVDGLRGDAVLVGGPVLNRLPWYTVASVDNLLQFADYGPLRPAGPLPHMPSCNMAMMREDFSKLGGFEHRGQSSGEDVILTSAARRRWPDGLVFVPDMRVAHLGRRSVAGMLRHHYGFGYVRGALGLHLTETHKRWGRLAALIPAIVLKRITYVVRHGVRYGGTETARVVLTLPLLVAGAMAWAVGFRRGLRAVG